VVSVAARVQTSRSEYEAARASTLNAHYTSTTVISGIYDALDRMGFDGGRVLEPALGIGHFFGLMPEEVSAHSLLTGVEIDPITAAIAQRLYPDGDIRSQGYESAALPNESFDLAISNVAFGDYKLHDQQFNDRTFSFTTTSSPRPSSTFGWAD
jgi:type I restriction-modification system DNA methylase subunit